MNIEKYTEAGAYTVCVTVKRGSDGSRELEEMVSDNRLIGIPKMEACLQYAFESGFSQRERAERGKCTYQSTVGCENHEEGEL